MLGMALVLFFVGMLPIVMLHPHVGVLLWALLGLMNPHRLTWGFVNVFPFAVLIGGATLASFVIHKDARRPLPWSAPLIFMTLLFVWMNVTTFFALAPDAAWFQWSKVTKIFMMTYVAMWLIHTKQRVMALLAVMTFSIGFYGVKGGIFTVLTAGQQMVVGPEGSLVTGNTEIALALIMTFPYMIWWMQTFPNKWFKWFMIGSLIAVAFAIVGSYSRGAFLAGGSMAGYLWLKSDRKLIALIAFAVLIPALMAFMPDKYHDKMGTIETYDQDASAMGRINAWGFAMNLAKDHPITGGGFDAFQPRLFLTYAPDPLDYHDAHSLYFQMLGHHGFPGLFLFLGLGASMWFTCVSIARRTANRPDLNWAHRLAKATQISLIGYSTGGAFLGLAYYDYYYFQVALVVALKRLVDEALAADAAPVPARGMGARAGGARAERLPVGGELPAPAMGMIASAPEGAASGAASALRPRAAARPGVRSGIRPGTRPGTRLGAEPAAVGATAMAGGAAPGRAVPGGRMGAARGARKDADKPKFKPFDLIAKALAIDKDAPAAESSAAAKPLARRRRVGNAAR